MAASHSYSFGEYTLDLRRGALLKAGVDVRLRPKSFGVLRVLVERHGQLISRNELLDAVWGTKVVVTDGVLTQCLIDIRRALGDDEQTIVRTVPRRGYIFEPPVEVANDSPLVDAASPAADRARSIGDPQLAEPPPPRETLVQRPSQDRLAWPFYAAISFFTIVAFAGAVAWWWGRSDHSMARGESSVRGGAASTSVPAVVRTFAPPRNSIAVLAFVNMSPEPDQDFFSDGVSEEILNTLAQSPDLHVIARTSSFSFKHQPDASVADIAAQLNVAPLKRRQDADPTRDPAAYEAFLRGWYFYSRRGPGDVERTMRNYREAVRINPHYARAWAELSGAYGLMAWQGDRADDWRARQREAAQRAVYLDPNLVSGHLRLARYYYEVSDRVRALEEFRKAAALAPDDPALADLADSGHSWKNTRVESLIAAGRRNVQRDPLSAIAHKDFGLTLFAAGHLDEALTEIRQALDLNPDLDWQDHVEVGRILIAQRRYDAAYAEIMRLPAGEARDSGLALLYYAPGRRAESEAALGRLLASPPSEMQPVRIAEVYALRDMQEEAFTWLQRGRGRLERDESLLARIWYYQAELYIAPFLQPLHADRRWDELMADPV